MLWADGANPGNCRASELEARLGGGTSLLGLAAQVVRISDGRPSPLKLIFLSDSWTTITSAPADHSDMRVEPDFRAAEAPATGTARLTRTKTASAAETRSRSRRRGDRALSLSPYSESGRSLIENMGNRAPFGNPADYVSPVALRPRLATGVLFRGRPLCGGAPYRASSAHAHAIGCRCSPLPAIGTDGRSGWDHRACRMRPVRANPCQ